MHTLKLRLKTSAADRHELERRFRAIAHVHNVMVRHARKLLNRISHDREYQGWLDAYIQILKKDPDKLTPDDKASKKSLSERMKDFRKSIGLSDAGFQSYLKACGRQFSGMLSSQQVQKEASRVWRGAEAVLFGNGKEIRFKKGIDFHTVSGKNNTNGAKFDGQAMTVSWNGLELPCLLSRRKDDRSYQEDALRDQVSYCEITREMFPNGWHYYVILYLRGDAPKKLRAVGDPSNTCGIDIGVSTVAAVSGDSVCLEELAPGCQKYNREIVKLQRHLDNSSRAMNPERYNPDGTYKKGSKGPWKCSNTYRKNRRRLKSLYRRKAAYIRQSHERLANELLDNSVSFLVEDMGFKALQRRSKKTERQDKESTITRKDGSKATVRKFKRKKRFGKSLNSRAPAEFLSILARKAAAYGGSLLKVDTKKFRASQYDHVTGKYRKSPLSERSKEIGGSMVQRDLYSAFLISNSNGDLTAPDNDKCSYGFGQFLRMQDFLINVMKSDGATVKQCFGF